MNVKYNKENDAYIYNLAFIKALLINASVDDMNISEKEKDVLLNTILEYLEKSDT